MATVVALIVLLAAPPDRVPSPRVAMPSIAVERSESDRELDLQRLPGGRLRHVDREGGFVAIVEPDGRVQFEPIVKVKRKRSRVLAWFGGLANALQRPPGQRDRPELEHDMPPRDDASRRAMALVETVNWGPYGPGPVLLSVGGSFDVSGPNAAKQREFMRRTKSMREAMALRFREKELAAATVRVTADVVAIWREESVPLSIRKQRIFALWDEAEAPRGDGPMQDTMEATQLEVRDRIERAVRRLAPAGSEDAFTEAELAELNARRSSRDAFEPYRARPTADPPRSADSR